jgi:hypothetical protein
VNPEPTWRLYRSLAIEAAAAPEVTVDDPRVLVGTMRHDDGRTLVWFVSQAAEPTVVAPRAAVSVRSRDDGQVIERLVLRPWEVVVAELGDR